MFLSVAHTSVSRFRTNKKNRKIVVFNGFAVLFLFFAEYAKVGLFPLFIFASVTVQACLQCRDSIRDDFYFILVTVCNQIRKPTVPNRPRTAHFHAQRLGGITVQSIYHLHKRLCAENRHAGFNMADMCSPHISHRSQLLLRQVFSLKDQQISKSRFAAHL